MQNSIEDHDLLSLIEDLPMSANLYWFLVYFAFQCYVRRCSIFCQQRDLKYTEQAVKGQAPTIDTWCLRFINYVRVHFIFGT
jgi:hypothetical protein